MADSPEMVPVRMLTQHAYCPRLGYMEWVQQEFAYNEEVVEGENHHRNVDAPSGFDKHRDAGEEDLVHVTSVNLSDEALGLTCKADLLELQGKNAVPVEYKRGRIPDNPRRAYDSHIVQLCAQGLLLRANGYACTKGVVYYVTSRKRVEVEFDDETVAATLKCLHDMRETAAGGTIPPPLVDSPKCPRCSLVGICLPDETRALSEGAEKVDPDSVRRMFPIRDDAMPVYVQDQGARVSLSGDRMVITPRAGEASSVRFIDISSLTLYGNVQVTTQAARRLCREDVSICYMSYGGRFEGITTGTVSKNVDLRLHQYAAHQSSARRMAVARQVVHGKIRNSITMLRRNHASPPKDVLDGMERLAERAAAAKQYEALLGMEGAAARMYFAAFSGMLKSDSEAFKFEARNRRPPKDPVNALLSYLYSLLCRQAVVSALCVGFDPYLGFLHMPRYGKPSLALDLMEEFRPIIADSTCLTLINNGSIAKSDMVVTKFGVNLTNDGRIKVIRAYERRMDTTVRHALLGYSASYRRILATQVRLLARHVAGEISSYPPFMTR